MPTKSNLGEFVEKDGKLYFIKVGNLDTALDKPQPIDVAGQSGIRSEVGFAYLFGYGIGIVILIPVLCLVVVFPMPLFAFLIGMDVLNLSCVR